MENISPQLEPCVLCPDIEVIQERYVYPANALVKCWYCKRHKILFRNESDLKKICVEHFELLKKQ